MTAALLIALLPLGQPAVPVDRPPAPQQVPALPWRQAQDHEVQSTSSRRKRPTNRR